MYVGIDAHTRDGHATVLMRCILPPNRASSTWQPVA